MRYKVGDRVRIKTWGVIVREIIDDGFKCDFSLLAQVEEHVTKVSKDRILTISVVRIDPLGRPIYEMKEIGWSWGDGMIECLESEWRNGGRVEKKLVEAEIDRFSLMDFE